MYILSQIRKRSIRQSLIKDVRINTQKISNSRNLTPAQETEIKQYWLDLLGIDIPLDWHRYFYRRTGVYSVKYIPTSLYYTDLIGRFNVFHMNEAYTDKNIADILLPKQYQPEVVIKNMNGRFFVGDKPVCKHDAIQFCSNINDVIIKPALKCHGDNVCKFSAQDGITTVKGLTIEQLYDSYNQNFIIQKVLHQHPQMDALNSSSVNTIRILTYHSEQEVLVLYSVIRIGKQGAEIDNETAGGISTRINANGTLCKYAYGAPGNDNVEKTDSGVVLEGYKIPSYDKAIDLAKRMHLHLPHFDLVGWDIAIDMDENPIIIEYNTWPELSQSANGPAFGEYTERVLKEIWQRANTRFF